MEEYRSAHSLLASDCRHSSLGDRESLTAALIEPAASRSCKSRVRNLLFWSVLTAGTIGSGTVTVCSMAGAEYNAALLWCVVAAVAIAWAMSDGTGRLTVISGGLSLGRGIRALSPTRPRAYARYFLVSFVLVGAFAYECNVFSGMEAVTRMLTGEHWVVALVQAWQSRVRIEASFVYRHLTAWCARCATRCS